MWILESEGEALKGKKYWLRPGQEYTMGRLPQSRIELTYKTVSKLHVTIKIGEVAKRTAGNLNERTTVSITDHDSKFGTWLDGAVIKNNTVSVSGTSHSLKLAKVPDVLRLSWQPIVFTNAGSRAAKVKQLTEKLESFEIKFISTYTEKTTYVMSPKINTAKGLAALIHQKYIVTDLFADALYSALSSIDDVLDPDSMPDPMEFLPATDEFSADKFAPNQARTELFKGLTFVFLDEKQYNNLAVTINAGLGKAVEFDPDGKTIDDLVKYANAKDGQVLLVQRNFDEDDTLCIEAAKRLGFEAITQSDFLEPVMKVDRSLLLKRVDITMQNSSSSQTLQNASPDSPNTVLAPDSMPSEIPDSVERPGTQAIDDAIEDIVSPTPVQTKMKPRPRQANTQVDLFNDFFTNVSPKQSKQIKQSPKKPLPRSSFDNHDPFHEFSSPQKLAPPPKPAVVEPIEEDEDFAPAATEMRKRLAAKGTQNTVAISDESDAGSTTKDAPSKGKGKKRAVPEDDEVVLAARERKRLALEQSRVAAEELAAAVKDHENLRNLGEVEVFSVDLSFRPPVRAGGSTRWDPTWNGRKNFKKFRRAKQSVTAGVGREMIRLVDYNGKTAASQEFFFPPLPERGNGDDFDGNRHIHPAEPSSDDFALDNTPGKPTRSTKSSRGSARTPNRSNRSGRQQLFVQDDGSDNDLGFDD